MFVWWQKAHLACKNRAPAIIKGKPSGSQTNLEWTLEKQAVQQITKVVVVVAVTVACGNSKLLCAERVNYGNQLLSEPENVAIIWQANAELQDSKNEVISVSQFTFKFNYTVHHAHRNPYMWKTFIYYVRSYRQMNNLNTYGNDDFHYIEWTAVKKLDANYHFCKTALN